MPETFEGGRPAKNRGSYPYIQQTKIRRGNGTAGREPQASPARRRPGSQDPGCRGFYV